MGSSVLFHYLLLLCKLGRGEALLKRELSWEGGDRNSRAAWRPSFLSQTLTPSGAWYLLAAVHSSCMSAGVGCVRGGRPAGIRMPADDQNIILLAKCAGAMGPREHGPHTLVVVAGIALMPLGPQASRLGSARRMGVSAWGQETAGLR